MHEQQKELTKQEKFNFIFALCVFHQRGIVVPVRKHWGKNALGISCLWAFGLMFMWAALTQDPFMYLWLGFWVLCYIKRRWEAARIYGQVNTWYDGCPINLGSNEYLAKRWLEPLLVGVLGCGLRWLYREQGWPVTGLPNFLILGVMTLPFVEWVKRRVWERRMDAMHDGRHEQEWMAQEYRNRFGG